MQLVKTTVCVLLCALAVVPALPAASEDAPAPVTTPSFVKDGVLDIEGAIRYFEDLYRSNSSTGKWK